MVSITRDFAPVEPEQLFQASPGYQRSPQAYVHPPLQKDPQLMPGLFDAEVRLALDSVKRLGGQVSDLVLRAPADLVSWVFDGDRLWWG